MTGAPVARRRILRFVLIAGATVLVPTAGIAAVLRLEFWSSGFHIPFALVLGVGGSVALGVALMALAFHSSRSGVDAAAGAAHLGAPPDDPVG